MSKETLAVNAKKTVLAPRKIGIVLIFGSCLLLFAYFARSKSSCRDIVLKHKDTSFCAIKADNQAERAKGLSGRQKLKNDQAMLFVFNNSDFHGIWMKDMKFNIDIVWLDDNKKIVDIKRNISPSSFPETFYPKVKSQYVIELNAGITSNRNLTIGDSIYW